MLAIEHSLMPAGLNMQRRDPELLLNYLTDNRSAPVRRVLSNSFGFGGSNASLVFGAAG
jgi:3-oxoacyl-[acyl-carrier-protein] synthase-1